MFYEIPKQVRDDTTVTMTNTDFDFKKSISELEEINRWFQEEEIDLDEGLIRLKKGKDLIQKCRDRLKSVENEFIKIKEEFNETDTVKKTDGESKENPF